MSMLEIVLVLTLLSISRIWPCQAQDVSSRTYLNKTISTSTWEGLSKSSGTVTVDQIQCAVKCSNMREECVGLYHDQTTQLCILLQIDCLPHDASSKPDDRMNIFILSNIEPYVLLISGGKSPEGTSKTELYSPYRSEASCQLGDLPDKRHHHSHCGSLLCGGEALGGENETLTSCLKFEGGHWVRAAVTLIKRRSQHLCWALSEGGIMLLGGSYSYKTTEVVKSDGSQSYEDFRLQYGTWRSCGIELGEIILVIGGYINGATSDQVTGYSRGGDYYDLGYLTKSRDNHACTKYMNNQGNHILLVTGGFNPTYNYLSSTEISTNQGSTWTELASAALPSARIGPRAITVNNRVLVLGGWEPPNINTVLEYDPSSQTMITLAKMTIKRHQHSVSIIKDEGFC